MRTAIAATVLLLLAAVGAVLALRARPGPRPAVSAAPAAPAASPSDLELRERLDALAAENRVLRERLALLEQRPAPEVRTPATDDFVRRDELEALRGELRAALAGRAAPPPETSVFREQVAEALDAIRKRERVEAVRGYQEKRVARLDEDVARIEEWLDLTVYQSDGMRVALRAQYDREDEQRRLWEEGSDAELLTERKRGDREIFRQDVARLLDPQQLETFWTKVGQGDKDRVP